MAKLVFRLLEFAVFLAIGLLVGVVNGAALTLSPWLLVLSIPGSLVLAVALWLSTLVIVDRWLLRRPPA
jgi:hypothetical protein